MPEEFEMSALGEALRALPSEPFRAQLRTDLERIAMTTATATTTSAYEPVGLHSVRPYLIVADGAAAIEFYHEAFGAEELERHVGPDGTVGHAKIRVADTVIELGEHPSAAGRVAQPIPGIGLRLYVADVDETYARAVAAGAPGGEPPSSRSYTSRSATVHDPFGLTWWLAATTA